MLATICDNGYILTLCLVSVYPHSLSALVCVLMHVPFPAKFQAFCANCFLISKTLFNCCVNLVCVGDKTTLRSSTQKHPMTQVGRRPCPLYLLPSFLKHVSCLRPKAENGLHGANISWFLFP